LREKGGDGFHHTVQIVQDLLIAETNNAIAFGPQPFIALGVMQLGFS
jgi:hypothetical protein